MKEYEKLTKKELLKIILEREREIEYTKDIIRDVVNSVLMICEFKTKWNMFTGRYIKYDTMLSELGRINLTTNIRHRKLQKHYMDS